nr:PREDICTED: ran-specific GTPase-activating protein-like [Bemisia tabaci]
MPVSSESICQESSPAEETNFDPHYEPIISLPEVNVTTMEENETEMLKLRAKLFRYDSSSEPHEWKERGTGDVKLLRHKEKNTVRVVMRRDKTLKICANHFITPSMELKPNCGSDRAWVWSVRADYADEVMCPELLAIRFANAENAKKWYTTFEEAKQIVATQCDLYNKSLEELINQDEDNSGDSSDDTSDSLSDDDGSDEKTKPAEESKDTDDKCDPDLNQAVENLRIDSKTDKAEDSKVSESQVSEPKADV